MLTRVLLLLALLAPGRGEAESFGRFIGSVVAEWLDDGRKMKLVAPFTYIDPGEVEWLAPAGSVVDGASIPRLAWSLIGGPFEGKYRNASVIHDIACEQRKRPWEVVHESFYYAMRASDVGNVKALIMYAAVYHFGPRWDIEVQMQAVPRSKVESTVAGVRAKLDTRSQVRVEVRDRPRSVFEVLTMQSNKADVSVYVRAPVSELAESDFAGLEALVNERATSAAGPPSLQEIRDYRPSRR
jgi:hypothetical protein